MVQKTRRELQRVFKTGAKPSSEDFKDFIESTLNITDDGLEKSPGANSPLRISAQGLTEKLLDFYVDDIKTWSIDQRLNENSPGFNLYNASGSKLFIADSNGNVGINTSSPTAKLQIQQTGNEDALRINDESGDNSPLIVKSDGKVGIGTTTPSAKLQIQQDGTDDALRINDQNNDTSPLIVKSDGKVGIGTDTPAAKVQIQQNGSEDALRINDSANDSTPLIVKSDGKVGIGTTNPTALLQVEQTGSEDALRINDSANDSTPLIVKSDGKVGIGTTNPIAKVQIQQTGSEDALRINDQNNDTSPLIVKSDGKVGIGTYTPIAKVQIQQTGSEDALRINDENNDTTPLVVKSDGKVGIGTTSPTAKLQINGDLKLQSGVAVNEFSTDGTLSGNNDLTIPTEKAVKTYVESVVVTGMIVMWSGASNAIPTGWALCDGVDGRPNLLNRFIMGAGTSNNKTSGNATSHSHTFSIPNYTFSSNQSGAHSHGTSNCRGYGKAGGNQNWVRGVMTDGGNHNHQITVGYSNLATAETVGEIRPKWYALCFIIRL